MDSLCTAMYRHAPGPTPKRSFPLTMILVIILTTTCSILLPGKSTAAQNVTMTANSHLVGEYRDLLSRFEGDPLKISPDLPHGRYDRTVAEMVIVVKALRLGGMDTPLEFIHTDNPRRAVEEVICGSAVITGQEYDLSVLQGRQGMSALYISDPVTRVGEFYKLFYTLPSNLKVLAARNIEELNSAGRGIIGFDWNNDRRVLTDMGITNLIHGTTFPSVIKMIAAGRADWIPMEASAAPDLARIMGGRRFVPVPGIRFSLLESRHFMVCRHHPEGKAVFSALQKGLKILRQQGFIRAILKSTGFYATDNLNWTTLNQKAIEREQARLKSQP